MHGMLDYLHTAFPATTPLARALRTEYESSARALMYYFCSKTEQLLNISAALYVGGAPKPMPAGAPVGLSDILHISEREI